MKSRTTRRFRDLAANSPTYRTAIRRLADIPRTTVKRGILVRSAFPAADFTSGRLGPHEFTKGQTWSCSDS
jgi:hypothetical protein